MSTNPWAVASNPAGSENGSTIDDSIRELRLDIRERMNEFLVGLPGANTWQNNPTVFKPSPALVFYLPWELIGAVPFPSNFGYVNEGFGSTGNVNNFFYVWVPLLRTTKKWRADLFMDLDDINASIAVSLIRLTIGATAVENIEYTATITGPISTGFINIQQTPGIDPDPDPDVLNFYYFKVQLIDNAGPGLTFHGLRLIYDLDSLEQAA